VTPHKYVTAIITERGIARAPYAESLPGLVKMGSGAIFQKT
jgi:methylthioribose-1-phosphate isomerase